jgi:hypothetical protein
MINKYKIVKDSSDVPFEIKGEIEKVFALISKLKEHIFSITIDVSYESRIEVDVEEIIGDYKFSAIFVDGICKISSLNLGSYFIGDSYANFELNEENKFDKYVDYVERVTLLYEEYIEMQRKMKNDFYNITHELYGGWDDK